MSTKFWQTVEDPDYMLTEEDDWEDALDVGNDLDDVVAMPSLEEY